jgi:hypothetical protein
MQFMPTGDAGGLMVAHSEEVPPRSFAHGAVRGGDG